LLDGNDLHVWVFAAFLAAHRIGTATDETAMRGFWSHYLSLMETG